MHFPHIFVLHELLSLALAATISHQEGTSTTTSREITKLHVLNVQISQDDLMSHANCMNILQKLEKTINDASSVIHNALDGRLFIRTVNVFLPSTWQDSCIPAPAKLPSSSAAPYSSSGMDVTITSEHSIFKNGMWTKQYGACGNKGSQIYMPFKSLGLETSGKEFAKEWSKYQFGIFDEHGYPNDSLFPLCYYEDQQSNHVTGCSDYEESDYANNCVSLNSMLPISSKARTSLLYAPEGPNVSMFCDNGNHDRYAPTKQNYLCKRKSTLDIILNNQILKKLSNAYEATTNSANITNTDSNFLYHRYTTWRYVVVIDDSIDNARRDSWNFLRIALRKWVLYDLKGDVEVGILLASGDQVIRTLDLTLLNGSKERELVAAFLPYTTNTIQSSHKNARATCLTCALKKANEMLKRAYTLPHNARNTIIVVAPGLDLNVDSENKTKELVAVGKNNYIVTINYPDINNRQPLDKLARALEGSAFTVQEQRYNSERSHIQTYFQLSTLMMQLAHTSDTAKQASMTGGLLEEIYRSVIYETSGSSSSKQNLGIRLSKGQFYYDADIYESAEFLVYTHANDFPLISGLKLVSPTGRTYTSLSDQRMAVKQLTLLASIDETGYWQYTIEHFNSGTTQPHIVQVVALKNPNLQNPPPAIQTHLHIQSNELRLITVACEVSYGKYPILNANVTLLLTRFELSNPNSQQHEFIDLLDNGLLSGIDVTQNDGIYTRQIPITQPGIYTFEVKITGRESETYTIREHEHVEQSGNNDYPQKCCGSSYAFQIEQEMKSKTTNTNALPTATTFLKTIKTFERYTKQKTVYIHNLGDFENGPQTALNIFDFYVHQQVQQDTIEFSWSGPNKQLLALYKKPEIKYEIRYAQYLKDIIDNFEACDLLYELTTALHITNYTSNMAYTSNIENLPLHMRGKLLTFAVKQLVENPLTPHAPAISNIQQLMIRPLTKSTTTQIPYLFTTFFQNHPDTNNEDNSEGLSKKATTNITYYAINDLNANESSDLSIKQQIFYYIIPALIALVMVVIISYLLWLILKCRRNTKNCTKNINSTTTVATISKSHQNISNSKLNYCATVSDMDAGNSDSHHIGSQTLCRADHHTLGIPIYSTEAEDDNNSTLKNAAMYAAADTNEEHPTYRIVTHPTPPPLPLNTIYALQQGLMSDNYLHKADSPFRQNIHESSRDSTSQENFCIGLDYDSQMTSNVNYHQLNSTSNNRPDLDVPLVNNCFISSTPPPLPPAPTQPNLHILNYQNYKPMTLQESEDEFYHHHHHQRHQPSLTYNNSSLLIEGIDTSGIAKRSRNVTMV